MPHIIEMSGEEFLYFARWLGTDITASIGEVFVQGLQQEVLVIRAGCELLQHCLHVSAGRGFIWDVNPGYRQLVKFEQ